LSLYFSKNITDRIFDFSFHNNLYQHSTILKHLMPKLPIRLMNLEPVQGFQGFSTAPDECLKYLEAAEPQPK
jgi:hypothetical protein